MSSRPFSNAERQRRYRQRQKFGLRVFNVVLDDTDLERLIDAGLLDECDGLDSNCVAGAIESLVESLDKPMSDNCQIMSALPPKADIKPRAANVRS